jgi:FixJ family two-component response regulator
MTIRSKQRHSASRKQRAEIPELRGRYDLLAHREHEVLELVVTGLLNKQIADKMGYLRNYGQNSSRPRHAQNASRIVDRPGAHSRTMGGCLALKY